MTPDNLTTAILLEVQKNCADNGGLLDYEKLRSAIIKLLAHSQQPQQDYVTHEDLEITASEMEWPDEIMDMIRKLVRKPSAEPEVRDGWVRVEDGTPEYSANIIFCTSYDMITQGFYNDGKWIETYTGIEYTVTHWMPLPTPPQH